MQKLEVFQSIWAMERRRPDGQEWSLEDQVTMVAEAGFDGMDIYTFAPEKSRAVKKMLNDAGLACSCCAFPKSIEGFQADLDMAAELEARHLNIIVQIYPLTVEEGADILARMLEMAETSGVKVIVETHRDCITTDMLYTLQLMESLPYMKMCADLSHFVVGREFTWPVPTRDEHWIQQVLDRSVAFQGRVASREQVQVQLDFPSNRAGSPSSASGGKTVCASGAIAKGLTKPSTSPSNWARRPMALPAATATSSPTAGKSPR
ncbi:MAG: TIM barrel protein [Rhodospirillaceae bacterium]|nr:TIM barrel protein [Rhodospirillaceae bacterium]